MSRTRAADVQAGDVWLAKVGGKIVPVRVDEVLRPGGRRMFRVSRADTNRRLKKLRGAQSFRELVRRGDPVLPPEPPAPAAREKLPPAPVRTTTRSGEPIPLYDLPTSAYASLTYQERRPYVGGTPKPLQIPSDLLVSDLGVWPIPLDAPRGAYPGLPPEARFFQAVDIHMGYQHGFDRLLRLPGFGAAREWHYAALNQPRGFLDGEGRTVQRLVRLLRRERDGERRWLAWTGPDEWELAERWGNPPGDSMTKRKKNARGDAGRREAERRAAAGDPTAAEKARRARTRSTSNVCWTCDGSGLSGELMGRQLPCGSCGGTGGACPLCGRPAIAAGDPLARPDGLCESCFRQKENATGGRLTPAEVRSAQMGPFHILSGPAAWDDQQAADEAEALAWPPLEVDSNECQACGGPMSRGALWFTSGEHGDTAYPVCLSCIRESYAPHVEDPAYHEAIRRAERMDNPPTDSARSFHKAKSRERRGMQRAAAIEHVMMGRGRWAGWHPDMGLALLPGSALPGRGGFGEGDPAARAWIERAAAHEAARGKKKKRGNPRNDGKAAARAFWGRLSRRERDELADDAVLGMDLSPWLEDYSPTPEFRRELRRLVDAWIMDNPALAIINPPKKAKKKGSRRRSVEIGRQPTIAELKETIAIIRKRKSRVPEARRKAISALERRLTAELAARLGSSKAENPGGKKKRKPTLPKNATLEAARAANPAAFREAAKRYKRFHGVEPDRALVVRVPGKGKPKVVAELGRVPETHYFTLDKESNKAEAHWVHKHLDGAEPIEVLDPETGLTLKIPTDGRTRVTDWWHD